MMVDVASPLLVVLYEGLGSEPLDDGVRFESLRKLLAKGYRVARVGAGGKVSARSGEQLVVFGRFGGRSPEELATIGDATSARVRSVEGMDADDILRLAETAKAESEGPAVKPWKPWFPVIDYDRCTNCMQCLSFCLFEVYGVSADAKIQVQHQANCKTDCPACSRVCPEVAILFPKYKAGPINGDEIDAEDLRREAMKVDISALLGGDLYAILRDRSARAKSRFSKERDDERALKERQRCLDKLQGELDIPVEVLAALPSVDDIQIKAAQALARANEARRQVETSTD